MSPGRTTREPRARQAPGATAASPSCWTRPSPPVRTGFSASQSPPRLCRHVRIPGEQVFNTYGAKSNEELLLGYGFVLPCNPADFLALKLSLPPSTPARLLDLLSKMKLDQLRHHVPQSGEIPPELLAQMRLLVAQPDELDAVIERASAASSWQEAVGFVSWENELDVLDALEGMLVSKLQALQQGEAADELAGIRPEVLEMVQIYRQGASSRHLVLPSRADCLCWARRANEDLAGRDIVARDGLRADGGQGRRSRRFYRIRRRNGGHRRGGRRGVDAPAGRQPCRQLYNHHRGRLTLGVAGQGRTNRPVKARGTIPPVSLSESSVLSLSSG